MKKQLSMLLMVVLTFNVFVFSTPAKAQESSQIDIWVPTNIEKVLKNQDFPEKKDTSIHMYSAKNEYEGTPVIIKAGSSGLKDVKVNITDLKHGNGSDSIGSDCIKIYKEHYIHVTEPTTRELKAGWYPDALIPLTSTFDVDASDNQGIWISVKVPKGQAAGLYTGKVEITSEGKSVDVPIEFNVWDFTLPDESSTKTAFSIWFGQVADYYGLKNGTKEYWDMQEKYYWFQNEYGVAPQDLPIPDDNVDQYIAGLKRFNSNPKVSGFRLPFYDKKDQSGKSVIDWDKNKELIDKLRANNLLGKAYYYAGGWIDEPTSDTLPLVREIGQKLKEIAPEVRHIVTREPIKALWGSVDTWAPILYYYDAQTAHNRQELGEHVWWYTCVNPKHPYPSYHIDDDLLGGRLLTWMQKDNGVEGNLYWATTIFKKYDEKQGAYIPRDVWNDPKAFPGANGDGYLMYPGKVGDVGFDGPVGTIRLEAIRDGLEDYEYLTMLEKKIEEKITRLGIKDEVKAAEVMRYFYDELYGGIDKYDDEPEKLLEMRKLVAEQILHISETDTLLVVKKVKIESSKETVFSETEREVNVYASKGSAVKVNDESLAAIHVNEKANKFTKKLNLNAGVNTVNIAIENGDKKETIQRTIKVKTSETNKDYEIPMFEIKDQKQLDKIVKSDVKLTLSEEYVAPGKHSIEAVFGTENGYPGFTIDLDALGIPYKDWSKYKAIEIDVFNPDADSSQSVFSKIYNDSGEADDSSMVKISPYSKGKLRIDIEDIKAKGKIKLNSMDSFSVQTWQAGEFKLYISNFRFISSKSVDEKPRYETTILDFEEQNEIDNLLTSGAEVGMSSDNATKGSKSLKVRYTPDEDWPQFRILADKLPLESKDWSKFKTLEFDVYNPDQNSAQGIYVKFFDNGDGSDDSSSFRFAPDSKNTVKIDLQALMVENRFNMKDVWGIEVGTWGPIDLTLYFDNFRLTSEEKVTPVNSYRKEAQKVAAPITIDGDLTKPVWEINTKLKKVIAQDDPTNLNEAEFGLLWDDKYLYVGVNIKDSILKNDGQYAFYNDAVEIYIDGTYNRKNMYDEHDVQLIVVYDCGQVALGGSVVSEFDLNKVIRKSKTTGTGYTMEVAVPWSELGVVPQADMKIGFDMFNDDNNRDQEVQNILAWAGNGNNWFSKSNFGEVTLKDNLSPHDAEAAATAAVVKAEASKQQSDYDAAKALVDGLTAGAEKTNLTNRLATVKAAIDKTKTEPAANPVIIPDDNTVINAIRAINAASDNTVITIDVSTNKTVAKEILDAVKGTDKTVTFKQNGVQWSFNGKDITYDTKAIDMTVNVAALSSSTIPNKTAIANKVKNADVLVISFANNGILPGKATIRMKLDENWLNGKDKNNIYIYYYNPTTLNVEVVAEKLKVDEEGYVQFTITHNSDYFAVDKDLAQAGILPKTGSVADTSLSKPEAAPLDITKSPKTGSVLDTSVLMGSGILLLLSGIVLILFKRKRTN